METVKNPYNSSNWLSCFFLFWVVSINRLTPKQLNPNSLLPLPQELDLSSLHNSLKSYWKEQSKKLNPSFLRALLNCKPFWFFRQFFFYLLASLLPLGSIIFLGLIISSLNEEKFQMWKSILFILGFTFTSLFSMVGMHNFLTWSQIIGTLIKAVGIQLLYQKVFALKYSELNKSDSTNMINLAAKDFEIFVQFYIVTGIPVAVIVISCASAILWIYLGIPGIIGVAFCLLIFFIQLLFSPLHKKIWKKTSDVTDKRTGIVNDLISGIRTLKLYNWENQFAQESLKTREKEVYYLKYSFWIRFMNQMIYIMGQLIIMALVYWSVILFGGQLSLEGVIVGISVIFHTISFLAISVAYDVEVLGSSLSASKRITQTFLMAQKLNQIQDTKYTGIKIQEISSRWTNETQQNEQERQRLLQQNSNVLNNITFEVKQGELCVILGEIGSGKTSLLMSILGELNLNKGKVQIGNSISYVPQVPWILSRSIKENILMDREESSQTYIKAVDACCLREDFDLMAYGDKTMVGEKGVTLSGGQKSRVSLARAVYQDKDIYLLDDPLSAVDPKVASKIFSNCINGLLKDKTRVLVTHQQFVLQYADQIILLQEGNIIFKGNYKNFCEFSQSNSNQYIKITEQPHQIQQDLQWKFNDQQTIVQQERETGEIPFSSYLKFILESFKYKSLLVLFFVFCGITQVPYVYFQIWIALWAESDDQSDPYYIQVLFGILAIIFIGIFLRTYIFNYNVLISCKNTYNRAFKAVVGTFPVFFDSNPSGRIVNRFSRDAFLMDFTMPYYVFQFFQNFVLIIGFIIAMVIYVPYNLILIVIALILIFWLRKISVHKARELRRIEAITRSPLFTILNEGLNGLVQIRSSNYQKYFLDDFKQASELNMRANFQFFSQARFFLYFCDLSMCLIIVVNAFLVGLWLGFQNESGGALALSFSVTFIFLSRHINRGIFYIDICMTSVERIQRYQELKSQQKAEIKQLEISKGKIEFKQVYMKYRPHLDLVLKDLSFTIFPSQKVGIVGRTGAGKSSILECLFRMVSIQSGSIYIDGQDISKVSLSSLRSQIGIIPQNPILFNTTLKKNLDPKNTVSDKEIESALKECGLYQKLCLENQSLYQNINQTALQLSLGQKQLFCLTRILLQKNLIWVLDEPTSSVDTNTDKMVQKVLLQKFQTSTVICIAHRISTIIESDKIIVMSEGSCKEFGKPEQLLQDTESMFYSMVEQLGPEEASRLIGRAI